jgi:hypothetical protein
MSTFHPFCVKLLKCFADDMCGRLCDGTCCDTTLQLLIVCPTLSRYTSFWRVATRVCRNRKTPRSRYRYTISSVLLMHAFQAKVLRTPESYSDSSILSSSTEPHTQYRGYLLSARCRDALLRVLLPPWHVSAVRTIPYATALIYKFKSFYHLTQVLGSERA